MVKIPYYESLKRHFNEETSNFCHIRFIFHTSMSSTLFQWCIFFYNTIQNLWLVFSEHVLVPWFENTLIIYSAEENSQAIELWRVSSEVLAPLRLLKHNKPWRLEEERTSLHERFSSLSIDSQFVVLSSLKTLTSAKCFLRLHTQSFSFFIRASKK